MLSLSLSLWVSFFESLPSLSCVSLSLGPPAPFSLLDQVLQCARGQGWTPGEVKVLQRRCDSPRGEEGSKAVPEYPVEEVNLRWHFLPLWRNLRKGGPRRSRHWSGGHLSTPSISKVSYDVPRSS